MSVQTNFRAVDMIGATKPVEVVVEKPVAPKAKAPKAAPVVVEEVVAPVEDVIVEEVAAPTEE
jgi:hypothetical protein